MSLSNKMPLGIMPKSKSSGMTGAFLLLAFKTIFLFMSFSLGEKPYNNWH